MAKSSAFEDRTYWSSYPVRRTIDAHFSGIPVSQMRASVATQTVIYGGESRKGRGLCRTTLDGQDWTTPGVNRLDCSPDAAPPRPARTS